MLTDLSIRDVVLIDRLDLGFDQGLSVLTGETGAGKSILLDALGLALGARAEARLVRHGCDQAVVTAAFALTTDHPAQSLLQDQGVDASEELILRRILGRDGRSRAYANDQPISVGLLRRLGETLVEIQGQFDQQGLMDAGTHGGTLDEFAGLAGNRSDCAGLFDSWQSRRKALGEARANADQAKVDEDYLRHAVQELEVFNPQTGEEDDLSDDRSMLQNAEKLVDAINSAYGELAGNQGADAHLRKAQKALERIADKAGEYLEEPLAALDRASVEIQETLSMLNSVSQDISADDGRLNDVEERLFALRDLARKHEVHPNDLPLVLERMRQQLNLIENYDNELAQLEADVAESRNAFIAAAGDLSEKRGDAARRLDAAVNGELPPLKLEKATFYTLVERLEEDHWNANGMDRVQFQVSTNPGAPAGPMSKIASGGELSRFLLALKVSLAETGSVPTLVFDEVDSGVGGATAAAIGERLNQLAGNVQVLTITHSPQVAARGRDHWQVRKGMQGEAMVTAVVRLSDGERREELARMLSGAEITDEARAAADRLIEGTES